MTVRIYKKSNINNTRVSYYLKPSLGFGTFAYTKNEVKRLVAQGYKVIEVSFIYFEKEESKVRKFIKDMYQTFLILTYSLNFFGGGFFYSILITRNENIATSLAVLFMGLSLFLYLKMDIDRETVFESVNRPSFKIIVLLMYILPVLVKFYYNGGSHAA